MNFQQFREKSGQKFVTIHHQFKIVVVGGQRIDGIAVVALSSRIYVHKNRASR